MIRKDAVKLMKNIVLEKTEETLECCRELFLEMAAFYISSIALDHCKIGEYDAKRKNN